MDTTAMTAFPFTDWALTMDHDSAASGHVSSTSQHYNPYLQLTTQHTPSTEAAPLRSRGASLSLPWRARSRSVATAARERRASINLTDRFDYPREFDNRVSVDHTGIYTNNALASFPPSFSLATPRRQSLILATSPYTPHKPLGLRGVLRRASVSIRSKILRRHPAPHHSPPANIPQYPEYHSRPRPETSHSSWRRLRRAASFRLSRSALGPPDSDSSGGCIGHSSSAPTDFLLHAFSNAGLTDPLLQVSQQSLAPSAVPPLPVPGLGGGPPIIPSNTGAAAKASAALQNEYLALSSRRPSLQVSAPPYPAHQASRLAPAPSDDGNDRESGIGIAVTNSDPDPDQDSDFAPGSHSSPRSRASSPPGPGISRVDFIASLPIELAIQILAHLDAAALAAASRVSRRWHSASANQHIWRDSFLREKTGTFATSGPVKPGAGLGVPPVLPDCDWKQVYRVRDELDRRWRAGLATAAYLHGHKDSIYCVQFDEHKIITGSRDKTIRIWDMHTFQCKLVIGPPEVLADTTLLVDDNNQPVHFAVLVGDRRTGGSMPARVSFSTHHKASILCLQYDDQILATGSSDASCIIYSIRSGYRPIRRLCHHTAAVLDLAFDSRHIVTCSKDATICVWERETGVMLRQLRGHTGPVNAVQMRGNTIVSCSGDFRVKLWNIDTGKNIREFVGHTKGLACSQFSEDGRYVASAGNDKTIRVWDANTGECLHGMPAHEGLVRSLHIDSVSGRLVSGGYDTDIKVFDLRSGDELLQFPRWHQSWVLSAKSDYRRIVSTGQDPKILILDFGADVRGIELLESTPPGYGLGPALAPADSKEGEDTGPSGYI